MEFGALGDQVPAQFRLGGDDALNWAQEEASNQVHRNGLDRSRSTRMTALKGYQERIISRRSGVFRVASGGPGDISC
jgi:hypothetical protein